ncbi:coiled-coil domain-containing protein 61 [Pseudonaja textilis]|uniref:Centrosomal protein CCDC61 n=1 Tax=Pseudonaja textilis TaxID=8673 RepID=A0A670ZN72_PSETE|nr:coiled-coil domain-containing protein 61 [Pseudonaja textilis]XP_026571288.1 coiled-coil domain-containing protein 61 [Pseudonaja textilis]
MAKQTDYGLQVDYVFRGMEHVIRMTTEGNLLEVEVEDRLTTDQWRGEFDAAFIEDLTHKTGNFKQFGIFCNMLESALAQSSESVTLDLLTYADLEALRNRKIGMGPRHPSASKTSPLNSKRYLILIYSVEFDRIHYPLPLPYVGKPDPVVLQKVIRELKDELAMLKAKPGKDFRDVEIRRLREELQRALEEKQLMESVLLSSQEELATKGSGLKEVKILKKVVETLEEQLAKERAKHQRLATRRLQESRQLADELAEVKAAERSLRIRVKNLTNELALYKKGSLNRGGIPKRGGHRSASYERSHSQERSSGVPWAASRPRSTSRDGRSGSQQSRLSRQSPSPTGIRTSRFDPTAFVKAKERKQKEIEQKNKRNLHRAVGDTPPSGWYHHTQLRGSSVLPGGSSLGKPRGRSSSVESFRSKRTSASSGSEMEDYSEPVAPRGRKRLARSRKPFSSSSWNGPTAGPRVDNAHKKRFSSTPHTGKAGGKGKAEEILENSENLYDEPSADLSEIDARLQALQEYMNKLETQT